jgi:hypothetical protein
MKKRTPTQTKTFFQWIRWIIKEIIIEIVLPFLNVSFASLVITYLVYNRIYNEPIIQYVPVTNDQAYFLHIPGTAIYLTAIEVAVSAVIISMLNWGTQLLFSWKNERRSKREADLRIKKLELEIRELQKLRGEEPKKLIT